MEVVFTIVLDALLDSSDDEDEDESFGGFEDIEKVPGQADSLKKKTGAGSTSTDKETPSAILQQIGLPQVRFNFDDKHSCGDSVRKDIRRKLDIFVHLRSNGREHAAGHRHH